eukprot:9760504-Lingulodinium_polyedra.AAC.1
MGMRGGKQNHWRILAIGGTRARDRTQRTQTWCSKTSSTVAQHEQRAHRSSRFMSSRSLQWTASAPRPDYRRART